MERYTIRILYRNRNNPEKLVGVVEGTGDTITRGFVSMSGLWKILNATVPGQVKKKDVSPGAEGHRSREELTELFWSLRER